MLRALLLTLACQSASPSSPPAGLSEPLSRLPAAPPWTWQGAGGDVYHSSATPAGVPLPSASTSGATVAARLAPFAPDSAAPLYTPALSARLVDGSGCAVLAQAAPAPCKLVFLDAHGALLYQWPTEQLAFPLAAAPTLDPKGRCVLRDARVRKRDWVCARPGGYGCRVFPFLSVTAPVPLAFARARAATSFSPPATTRRGRSTRWRGPTARHYGRCPTCPLCQQRPHW